MNKEKIKKGAVDMCEKHGLGWNEATYLIDDLFCYLDSKGVVIKVERGLPNCGRFRWIDLENGGWAYDKEIMRKNCPLLKAGYEAVESLVEGK